VTSVINHIFVISHRRSGTHIVIDTIRNNFADYSGPFLNVDQVERRHKDRITLDQFMSQLSGPPKVIKSHMHRDIVAFFENNPRVTEFTENILKSSKIIYVYRDVRDVLTSLYFYIQSFRKDFADINISEFIRMDNDFDGYVDQNKKKLSRIEYWYFHVAGWYNYNEKNILYISFEQLITDYDATVRLIGHFLNINQPDKIKNVLIKGACRNDIKYSSVEFRKGIVGDYRHYLSQEDLNYIHTIASNLLVTLGYN
jgi:hypothetical protein